MSIGPLAFPLTTVIQLSGTMVHGEHMSFSRVRSPAAIRECASMSGRLLAHIHLERGGRWTSAPVASLRDGGVDRGDVGSGRTRSILTDGLWVGYRRRPRGRMPNVCRGASHRGSRGSVLVAEQAVYSGFLQVGHRSARMVGPEMLFTHLKRTLMKSLERLAPSIRKRQSASMFSS